MTQFSRAERRHFIPSTICTTFLSHGALTQFNRMSVQSETNVVVPHKYPRPGIDWSILETQ